jgi:ATP-dependent Clp protease ATP-binding subunit ClpA
VFERFTQRARHAVVLAQEEARGLQHHYIGTEHLLLGLIREEEGIAARVLASLDVTLERVRARVLQIVGAGDEVTRQQIPFTPRAKKVLELSLRESQALGHNHIGTEHILLGVVREGDGMAAVILREFDAEPEKVRNEVIRMLSGPRGRHRSSAPAGRLHGPLMERAWLETLGPLLDRLSEEIRRELHREPDLGDLLVVLACAPDTLAGRAVRELGVDLDALRDVVERTRTERDRGNAELERQAEEARRAKEDALEAGDWEKASAFRDQEREFSLRRRGPREVAPEVVHEIRRRLGLPELPEAEQSL